MANDIVNNIMCKRLSTLHVILRLERKKREEEKTRQVCDAFWEAVAVTVP
jgi:hypothetical protein